MTTKFSILLLHEGYRVTGSCGCLPNKTATAKVRFETRSSELDGEHCTPSVHMVKKHLNRKNLNGSSH